jgi:CheY-specific phosphatase CheX
MENIRKIEEMLLSSIFEVFEKMFFVFAEPLREAAPPCPLKAVIGFESGLLKGDMRISLTPALARTMARNMLSLEEDEITEPIMADCVKESINMICGSFLRKVDPVHGSSMSIPTYEVMAGGADRRMESGVQLVFATECGAFEIGLDT